MDKHHHHPFREHEHHHRDHTSSVTAVSFKSDRDDEPFTNEDLQAIDAALQSASKRPRPSSSHNHDDDDNHNYGSPDPPTGGGSRRRLPSSILASQEPNPFFFQLAEDSKFCIWHGLSCRVVGRIMRIIEDETHTYCRRFYEFQLFAHPLPIYLITNLRMRYPVMKFGGQITYSRTVAEVEAAAMELLKTVEAKNREVGEAIVGFDIEWRPTFKKVLEGSGKGIDPRFDITELPNLLHAIPCSYALELLKFREVGVEDVRKRWDMQSRAFYNLFRQADRVKKLAEIIQRLEHGDLKLRVRALESERTFQRIATIQKTIGSAVAAGNLVNLATILYTNSIRRGNYRGIIATSGLFVYVDFTTLDNKRS
ncbi:hypothetical protein FEM48_Zijuj12G0163700 [Ziziphus jujuba var. spinosa]|uniref:Uncharacterized protein n=1 Tax=Ziziphus jujuba var. spinosa TaxID=714518 RepID=A0A978UED5_ZIZJJ|nr:hypothetical protein FEM48_Zijuj12G0163700 [Ziziphus jujuba var. spinosa]